jgi:hypothetical protein
MEKYKITKTIRLKLESYENSILKLAQEVEEIKKAGQNFALNNFVTECNNMVALLKEYLYCKDQNGNITDELQKSVSIKRSWLRLYAKNIYYKKPLCQKTGKELSIGKTEEFEELMKQWFERFKDIIQALCKKTTEDEHNLSRHAAIGLLIKKMSMRNNFQFISTFIDNSNNKSETETLSLRLKNSKRKIESMLEAGLKKYLPSQSNGFPLAKASFNYYTIFKNSIDFGRQIEKEKENLTIKNIDKDVSKLNTYYDKKTKKKENFISSKEILRCVIENIKNIIGDKMLRLGDAPEIEIDTTCSLRQILKNIKSEQKKAFNELMQQNDLTYKKFPSACHLFLFKDIKESEFKTYKELTQEIEKKAAEKNSSNNDEKQKQLRSKIEYLKQKRGEAINGAKRSTQEQFKVYKSFCNFYRNVAQKHGKILALLKGIEKERVESQQLKYWAIIAEEQNRHLLVLIPKEGEKAKECKEFIESCENSSSNKKIYWFESLTLRSLRKLCFGYVENQTNTNTFYPEIEKEFINTPKNSYIATDNSSHKRYLKKEYELESGTNKIQFYKDVLSSEYAGKVLNLPFEQLQNEIIDRKFDDNLNEFGIALEKICYRREVIYKDDIIRKLQSDYNAQIFEITSLDIKNSTKKNLKTHTQIWKSFWKEENVQNGFDVRLNPEITISWRDAKESRVKKYGKNSELYDENKKNRYLHPQYTLITTIFEHSNSPTKNLSFITDDEFKNSVEEFNQKLKKEDIKFAIGLDNGEVELSTLGIYLPNFQKDTNEEKMMELKNAEKYGFEVLTIKDLHYNETNRNGKVKKIIQNPSYFLNQDLYMCTFGKTKEEYNEMFEKVFDKKRLLTLDLTTAKVINGYIVTNGDVPTHFNLRIKNAQRLIYKMNDHLQEETSKKIFIKSNTELTDEEKTKYNTDVPSGFFAVCHIMKDIHQVTNIPYVRNVFYKREEFYFLKTEAEIKREIDGYNTNKMSHISNEELDIKINNLKQSIVANSIGVIDFLYKQYKDRFNGEGLIIKEGFDTSKVANDLKKFSGNIYRILERKLYQKFQNYGLVPPIKNLMAVRAEGIQDNSSDKDNNKNKPWRLGNIGFVSDASTSQICPICNKEKLNHTTICPDCVTDCTEFMRSNDGVASFNIAKRGFLNFEKETIGKE